MDNSFKLELKKKQSDNNIFYKYSYETCKIWFDQDQITGNIYRVNISDEQYGDVEYYSYDTEDRFYPTNITTVIPTSTVKNDSDYTALNKKVQYCCLRRYAIENFLLSGDHYKLYCKCHKLI